MDEMFKKKLIEKNKETEKRRLIAQGLIDSDEDVEMKRKKNLQKFGQGFKKALDWE